MKGNYNKQINCGIIMNNELHYGKLLHTDEFGDNNELRARKLSHTDGLWDNK